jgi:N4-gp56 family major capsid protein
MAVNHTTSTLSANLHVYYVKKLLDTLGRDKVIEALGVASINIPKGNGVQAKWLRYDEFNVSDPTLFLLTESVIPSESALTTRNLTATALQYGTYVAASDKLVYSAIDPVMESMAERLGEHAGQLIELLCRNECDSNGANQFANGKASLATTGAGDVLTAKELLKAMITFKKASVPTHESGNYVAVIHPACAGDLMNDTNVGSWSDLNKYVPAGRDQLLNAKEGMCYGVKVKTSDLISSTTVGTLGSALVYSNLVFGKAAFGTVKLGSKNVEFHTYDEGSTANPLKQFSTTGYKALGFVAKAFGGSSNGTADRIIRIRAASNF